ncbi:HAMP domain-containing histidine kinase [Candidatus Saccharibacteria bacterium]|nr:HAMP domain-containing histidine kinase [Candidatus Saccharibacteria bacterium]
MNHLKRFSQQLTWMLFFSIITPGVVSVAGYVLLHDIMDLSVVWSLTAIAPFFLIISLWSNMSAVKHSVVPIEKIWQAIWHISPEARDVQSPTMEDIKVGRELVSSMVMQIYELASHGSNVQTATTGKPLPPAVDMSSLLEHIPQPVFVLDKDRVIGGVNNVACIFLGQTRDELIGKSTYDVLRMSFQTVDTLDLWLDEASKSLATATKSWEHVRTPLSDGKTFKQFDLAASYSKENTAGYETVITLFDRTATYARQDEATSYVALAVHELRTPLTILRGYIEVFDDELGSQLTPELREFMRKMGAAAQSLTAFVSNILNVARVDENQLVLSLHEADWNKVLPEIAKDLELRASVRGKTIELDIEAGLPSVAIDKISMYEVVSNLVDNAIKYGGLSLKVIIHAKRSKDGTIETVIQDFGLGIPENAMSDLFTKFYRSHSSKNAVSGSGLGLYLVKAIISAHGGNVWVNSKEGEGSSFGFSLQTYEIASSQAGAKASDGIERQASGWIKNHSLYRR